MENSIQSQHFSIRCQKSLFKIHNINNDKLKILIYKIKSQHNKIDNERFMIQWNEKFRRKKEIRFLRKSFFSLFSM